MNKLAAQIEILEKYAQAAEELLIENGEAYSPDDVIKVASFLIDYSIENEQQEKIAEMYEVGREVALDRLEDFFLKEAAKGWLPGAKFIPSKGGLPGEGVTRLAKRNSGNTYHVPSRKNTFNALALERELSGRRYKDAKPKVVRGIMKEEGQYLRNRAYTDAIKNLENKTPRRK